MPVSQECASPARSDGACHRCQAGPPRSSIPIRSALESRTRCAPRSSPHRKRAPSYPPPGPPRGCARASTKASRNTSRRRGRSAEPPPPRSGFWSCFSYFVLTLPWLHQVPQIAVQIREHRHAAIGRVDRRADEAHAFGEERRIVAFEIVGVEEEEDAPARLVADERRLLPSRGAGEEERGAAPAGAGRGDQHPSLALLRHRIVGEE